MTDTKSIKKTVNVKVAKPDLYNSLYPGRSKTARTTSVKPLDDIAREKVEIQSMLKHVLDGDCIEIKNAHTALIFAIATAKVVNADKKYGEPDSTTVAINLYLLNILKMYDKCLVCAQLTVYDNDLQLLVTYNGVSIRDAIEQEKPCKFFEPAYSMLFTRYDPRYYIVSCEYEVFNQNDRFYVAANPNYDIKTVL